MTEREMLDLTKRFALRVMKLVDALPRSRSRNAIAGQLVRSGTSVAANYRAACRGRSKAEFAAKLGTVEEEADECALWMELIMEGELLNQNRVAELYGEARQITAMMAASRMTSRKSNPIANRKSQIANS